MVGAQILLVEDEKIVALEIQDRLKILGYSVSASVSTGEEAIDKAEKLRPDLVLMDIQLKGKINGTAAAEQIRTRFGIPIIYLTAYADDDTLQYAKIAEPFGYLLKPFEERELHSTIEMALHRSTMEKKLRENEQWLSTTLKSIGDAVITTDNKGCVTFMNRAAESITGWTRDEVVKKSIKDVFHVVNETTGKPLRNPVSTVIQKGTSIEIKDPIALMTKNKTKIPIDASCAPIQDDIGNITGVVVVFRDIAERRKTEEALREGEARMRSLFNGVPVGLYRSTSEGKIIDANPAAVRIFGYPSCEAFLNDTVGNRYADSEDSRRW